MPQQGEDGHVLRLHRAGQRLHIQSERLHLCGSTAAVAVLAGAVVVMMVSVAAAIPMQLSSEGAGTDAVVVRVLVSVRLVAVVELRGRQTAVGFLLSQQPKHPGPMSPRSMVVFRRSSDALAGGLPPNPSCVLAAGWRESWRRRCAHARRNVQDRISVCVEGQHLPCALMAKLTMVT